VKLIGYERSSPFGRENVEHAWWIGKPWRRVELLVHDIYFRGARVDRSYDLSVHLGILRLGLGGELRVFYAAGFDYSDEPNQ
jgi:hypothetical protein